MLTIYQRYIRQNSKKDYIEALVNFIAWDRLAPCIILLLLLL